MRTGFRIILTFIVAASLPLPGNAFSPPQAAPAGQQAAAPGTLPKIVLFATGGTISNKTGGRLTVEELIQSVPDLGKRVRAEGTQFTNVSSGQITMEQWLDLSRQINERLKKDADIAGVVVTSGTDTLEELAYFLHLTDPRRASGGGRRLNAESEHHWVRRRGEPRRRVSRRRRAGLTRHGHIGGAQRRDQLGA